MASPGTPPKIRTGQLLHFGGLAAIIFFVWYGWSRLARPFPIASLAATVVATFNPPCTWIHFYCPEKPDMDFLCGSAGK